MKINIAYPATGAQKMIEVDDERKLRIFYDKRMATEVKGDGLGDEFKGYVFKITGGNDKQGFPMKQGVLLPHRVRLLLSDGHSCYRSRRTGERKRKSVRGCIVGADISALSLVVMKQGEQDIPGLTDLAVPKRLGPKRASNIRKMFNLAKEDDVRKYVIRRDRKRNLKAVKRRNAESSREAAAEYAHLLAQRIKEKKEKRHDAHLKRRLSSTRKSASSEKK
ncbi:hypothetical protein BASA60_008402 [Batrachochytrium salamandrivorans]|nr:hypothetical protein BASA60_008402 [Batrachochytrium salamandrivorans]